MKNWIILLFSVIFAILMSCNNPECDENRLPSVRFRNSFNPVVLSFFPYTINDTISYSLDGATITNAIVSLEMDTVVQELVGYTLPDCGYYEVDEQYYKTLRFKEFNEFGMFELKLTPFSERLKLNFKLGSPVYQTYELNIDSRTSVSDTLTLNNILYTDVYTRIDSANRLEIYYSKSKGLLKILDKNITIFKIL